MDFRLIEEFEFDWRLAGKAPRTAALYARDLRVFIDSNYEQSLLGVKQWLADTPTAQVRRKRAQAIRAIGKWCESNQLSEFDWWRSVPLANVATTMQETATAVDYEKAINAARTKRDKAIIEVLWSCGLRRTEISELTIGDVVLSGGYLVVRKSKSGSSRVVPLPMAVRKALRPLVVGAPSDPLFVISSNGIRLLLRRLNAPSAHAWRRGWAVRALRMGVSEASVKSAAGWSSGAMVSRYTRALSSEIAIDEFRNRWY
jgi:integrase